MTDNVVFLLFENKDNTDVNEFKRIACKECMNQTFTCRYRENEFPTMECAACGYQIGAFGWASLTE